MANVYELSETIKRFDELTEDVEMKYEPGTYDASLIVGDEDVQFFKRNEGVTTTVSAGTEVGQNVTFNVKFQVANPSDVVKVKNAIINCAVSYGETAFKSNEKLAKAIKTMCGVKCVVSINLLFTSYTSETTVNGLKGEAIVGLRTEPKILIDNAFGQSLEA